MRATTMTPPGEVPDGVLVASDEGGSWAWVGVRLAPAATLAQHRGYLDVPEPVRRAEATAQEQAWLAAQWTTQERTRFEVRYVNDPLSRRLSATLLGQVHGPDQGSAAAAALRLRDRLAAAPRHVRADPIGEAAEVYDRLHPIQPDRGALYEVRKRLTWSPCTRTETHRTVCVAVSPFGGANPSWEPVWAALAALAHPTVVSVFLEPYQVGQGLRARLGLLAQEYAWLAREGPGSPLYGRRQPPDPFAVAAAPIWADAVRRYTDRGYRIRISLAAAGPLPAALAEHLAALAEHLAAVVSAPVIGGGATVRRLPPGEFDAAYRQLTALGRDWLEEAHGQGTPPDCLSRAERILCDLADLSEATAAFRFPYQIPGHVPLFEVLDPPRPTGAGGAARAPVTEPARGDPGAPVFEPPT
jgi:hypothetical protein